MASKKQTTINTYKDAPENLDNHPFYGLNLDEHQKEFRDAIWDPNKLIVFCNAKAGSGKTTIAAATANLLYLYGKYNGIVYIVSPYGVEKQGFLPGDITEKSEIYFEPFYQALIECNVNINTCIADESMINQKNGTAYIKCLTHTFLRGTNLDNKVVILDESQNMSVPDLKKILTRCHDNCKVIVIGHDGQCDMLDSRKSGFVRYIDHFDGDDRVSICELTKNYRGWISQHADDLID